MAPCARVHFFCSRCVQIEQKQRKARDHHAMHRRGGRSPSVQPAPPTHPASSHRARPSTAAGFRTRHPPQVEPGVPDWRDSRRRSKAGAHVRQRRRRQLSSLSSAPPRSRRRSRAGWSSATSQLSIVSKSNLRPISLRNGALQRVCRASEGKAARACRESGTEELPHDGRRPRTSSGLTARRSQRSCRLGASVPARSALNVSPQLEHLNGRDRSEFLRMATPLDRA